MTHQNLSKSLKKKEINFLVPDKFKILILTLGLKFGMIINGFNLLLLLFKITWKTKKTKTQHYTFNIVCEMLPMDYRRRRITSSNHNNI